MKILSVDDSKIIRKLVFNVIETLEYDPVEAADGAAALEVLEKEHEDVELVILDWNMPVMDGLSCLERIKSDARFARIPVMMLTTESQADRIAMALRAGATNYATKPFTPEELIGKILDTLGLS